MPLTAEARAGYGPDWDVFSLARREAAGWRCECTGQCGATPHPGDRAGRCGAVDRCPHPFTRSAVVLTVAHLNGSHPSTRHDTAVLCQRCHLRYDQNARRALVAEPADAPDSRSGAVRRGGSTPPEGT